MEEQVIAHPITIIHPIEDALFLLLEAMKRMNSHEQIKGVPAAIVRALSMTA